MSSSTNVPLGIWIQLANLFFLLSGLYSDLLLIRAFLVIAYGLLLLNGFVGSPLWPSLISYNKIQLDTIVWSIIGLYVHATSLVRLLLDERTVSNLTDDEEALWRMFYRCGGLSKKIYQVKIVPHVQIIEFCAGETISTDKYFYILYKGTIQVDVTCGKTGLLTSYIDNSGQVFDLKDMDLLYDQTPFDGDVVHATAITNVKVFQFTKDSIRTIVQTHKSIWQTILIENLIRWVAKQKQSTFALSNTVMDSNYCHPLFLPLEEWEQPEHCHAGSGEVLTSFNIFARHVVKTMYNTLSLPWPIRSTQAIGLRQNQLPAPKQSNTTFESLYDAVQQQHQKQTTTITA